MYLCLSSYQTPVTMLATHVQCLHAAPIHAPKLRNQHAGVMGARHPDYIATSNNPWTPAEVKDRPDLEADVRYRRLDNSSELAAEARYAFAAGLAVGEAGMQLARQALLIAAEDDAIASSSVVKFPVDAFMARIQRVATDTAAALAAAATAAGLPTSSSSSRSSTSSSSGSSNQQWASIHGLPPSEVIAAVQHMLFQPQQQQPQQEPQQQQQQEGDLGVKPQTHSPTASWYSDIRPIGYKLPPYGRSNLPTQSTLDHPGVWEDARMAYLNEVLVRKTGSPAALVILYCEVYRQLLLMGAIDFAVTFDYRDFNSMPVAQPLPNFTLQQLVLQPTPRTGNSSSSASSSSQAATQGQRLLNTCSSEALCELLRHLKRAYWPFPWDTNIDCFDEGGRGSTGGFRAAAKAALGSDEMSAALKVISATAAHRLQRGIWTSPGAGDLNRCLAASERLVMMAGDQQPQERRDLAVLLLHAGQPSRAAAELSAYLDSVRRRQPGIDQGPFDVRLAQELWKMLRESGVKPAREVMSVEAVLRRGGSFSEQAADSSGDSTAYKPLIW